MVFPLRTQWLQEQAGRDASASELFRKGTVRIFRVVGTGAPIRFAHTLSAIETEFELHWPSRRLMDTCNYDKLKMETLSIPIENSPLYRLKIPHP
jgi:hypothetical protein